MREIIFNNIQKNRYSIYSFLLAFIICCLTFSENFFYNYLIIIWFLLAIFLIFSIYTKIETEYFYVTGFFILTGSILFFLFSKAIVGVRFLYLSLLIIVFGFFTKYFYRFYEWMERSCKKEFINLGFLVLSIIIILSSVLSFINFRNNINLSEKYYKEAINLYEAKDYYNAIDILHKSINFNKLNYEACNLLGRLYSKIENFEEGKKYLIRAIRLKSGYFDAIIALGSTYEKGNEFDKAIDMYKKARKMRPGDFGAHFGLGRTYYKIDDFEKSLIELLKAEKKISNNYQLQYLLGNIYYNKSLYKEALEHFNLIRNKEVPKELKIDDGKSVEDFIEEINKKIES